ncbi:hypothetical protein CEP52_009393 [Fusarium oligoseptatum]|uniref:Sodium/calcium exchanger membrane region domain-containing protein n=1 Tax=Fusarium oligoseptatum TaxID=2604345 RepID=A0A428TDD2_9HYPO|nr:hypothetical protein CEP52_009393 [Fusarium oligoseptatum]
MPRRVSTTLREPRRDSLFSADDDTAEVEADAFRRRLVNRRKSTPPGFVPSEHHHAAPSGIPRLELTEAPDELPVQNDAEVESDAGSFTLKLRQQAINETHPFGIRLWKPALYQQDGPPDDDGSIPSQKVNLWSLLFNILWTTLFGWWLAVLATVGGLVCGNSIFLIDLMGIALIIIFNWLILQKLLHIHFFTLPPGLLFPASLLGIIPLAYFIGKAIASISAQSSMGVSAVVNAFFSTMFEVLFYCVALRQGKSRLVEGCIIGSIFAGVLFIPGLSMCFGALKCKTQRFNSKSAGVTSTMLLFAIIGVFSPTLFYAVYGTHVMRCRGCSYKPTQNLMVNSQRTIASCRTCSISQELDLDENLYVHVLRPFSYFCAAHLLLAYVIGLLFTLRTHAAVIWARDAEDKKHLSHRRRSVTTPLTQGRPTTPIDAPFDSRRYSFSNHRGSTGPTTIVGSPRSPCRAPSPLSSPLQRVDINITTPEIPPRNLTRGDCDVLPHLPEEDDSRDGTNRASISSTDARVAKTRPSKENDWHSVPNWSRTKSLLILLGATILYGILANIMIEMVDSIRKEFHVDEKFVGLTIFALVPNTTEIWNAILFAVNGNIALSMEIGSAYVLQVCLIQILALVFFSVVFHSQPGPHEDLRNYVFPLIFPQWDMVLVVICVFLLGYLYGEGKSNYFKGSILLLAYVVVVAGFYFSGVR